MPSITRTGVLTFSADGFLVALGTILAVRIGLIEPGVMPLGTGSLSVVPPLKMLGICGSLMLCGGYRHPAPGPRATLISSACVAALTALIILSPGLASVLNGSAPGWSGIQGGVLYAVLIWILLFSGRCLLGKGLDWYRRRLEAPPVILIVHEADAIQGEVAALVRLFGGRSVTDSEILSQNGPEDLDRFTDIVFAGSWANPGTLRLAVSRVSEMAANVHAHRSAFDAASAPGGPPEAEHLRGIPVATLSRRPLTTSEEFLKRAFDVALSVALIVLLLPVFALIAAAIRIDSKDPVLFRQDRHGYNNKPFQILKFRSMKRVEDVDEGAVIQASRNDMRVTRVGRILRRLSLDELPQIFNVLRGDMSLVGPRPHALAHHRQYCSLIESYALRHRIKPGITGWAQVHGFRGETDTLDKMAGRVAYDLEYIENWSLALDVRILLATLAVGFVHKNAY
jgi:exopolysaccharide biosynthesis polyprenyl glycosylphosphotransferase